MFEIGDVVRFFSPTAGKEKFHLCLGRDDTGILFAFLHLNSDFGYRGDCVLNDGRIPGLPVSRTGKSVVSFSAVVRMGTERLRKFGAEKTGEIDVSIAEELLAFAREVQVLTGPERALVVGALERCLN
jgi:hypothetical protein